MAANEDTPKKKKVLYTELEVKALLANDSFKKFCKKKCGECGAAAFKKYASVSPLVVRAQIGAFWCSKCGRLLCDAHRNQHTCEREDAEFARKRNQNVEDVRADLIKEAAAKEAADEVAAALKRAADEKKAALFHMWKDRRKHAAGVSTTVANMAQRWAVQAESGTRAQDELLELYTSCNRINLRLWNEVTQPTLPGAIDDEAYAALVANYDRARDLTGLVIVVEGIPLDTHLPWVPRPAPAEAPPGDVDF